MATDNKLASTNPFIVDKDVRIAGTRRQVLESSFFEGARGLDPKRQVVGSDIADSSARVEKPSSKP